MIYQDFKDYVVNHLWKVGDAYVIDNLDKIIQTAHTELERVLREVPERDQIAILTADTMPYPLPADCHRIRGIKRQGSSKGMQYLAPYEWFEFESHPADRNPSNYYSTSGDDILFYSKANLTVHPETFTLWYERKIPDYAVAGSSWVADQYLDLYLYCVLKHTAPFLREDERLAIWGSLYAEALNSVTEDGADRRYSGSPLHTQWNGTIR